MDGLTGPLGALTTALDALCAEDPQRLCDREAIKALHRQLARLEAATTRASAAFDAGRDWEDDKARSSASWIATACHLPTSTARRRVRLGRELRLMDVVEKAWLAGDIGEAQVGLLARARTPRRAETFTSHEELLVGYARSMGFGSFARVLAYWCYRADPDGSEAEADDDYKSRRLHLSSGFRGTQLLDGVLDPIGGAIVADELARIDKEFFDADWAEAKERVGAGVCAADLWRTPAQRRADALVEMARRSGAVPPGARMPEPLFSVLVDYETMAGRICELASGEAVTPGSLLRYLDAAWIERVVFGSPSRVIDMGVRRRLFTGATRRAVQVRDRECFHEFCETRAADCQIDHVEPYTAGGLTIQDNGRVACDFHNRARHRRPEP
jgi:hypothetical protein